MHGMLAFGLAGATLTLSSVYFSKKDTTVKEDSQETRYDENLNEIRPDETDR